MVSMLLFLTSAIAWAAPPPSSTPAAPTEDVLRAAVLDAERKLGELQPWQQTLFQEEVVPQYARFVKGYRPTNTGIQVDVDVDSVRKYLSFKATKSPARFMVAMRPDDNCAPCMESALELKKLVEGRLKRRGFTPIFIGQDEVGDPKLAGKLLDEKLTEINEQRQGSGALVLEWTLAPTDNIDTAHADEKRYLVRLFVLAREDAGGAGSGKAARETKTENRMELMEADAFDRAAGRLLTDSFTDIGARSLVAVNGASGDQSEIAISVAGIKDFAHFTSVKARIQAGLQALLAPGAVLEDRRISRGKAVFAARAPGGPETVGEVKRLLSGLSLEKGVLGVTDADPQGRTIHLEIR